MSLTLLEALASNPQEDWFTFRQQSATLENRSCRRRERREWVSITFRKWEIKETWSEVVADEERACCKRRLTSSYACSGDKSPAFFRFYRDILCAIARVYPSFRKVSRIIGYERDEISYRSRDSSVNWVLNDVFSIYSQKGESRNVCQVMCSESSQERFDEAFMKVAVSTLVESLVLTSKHRWISLDAATKVVRVHCMLMIYNSRSNTVSFVSPHLKDFGLSRKVHVWHDTSGTFGQVLSKFHTSICFDKVPSLQNLAVWRLASQFQQYDVTHNIPPADGNAPLRCVETLGCCSDVKLASIAPKRFVRMFVDLVRVIHFGRLAAPL